MILILAGFHIVPTVLRLCGDFQKNTSDDLRALCESGTGEVEDPIVLLHIIHSLFKNDKLVFVDAV